MEIQAMKKKIDNEMATGMLRDLQFEGLGMLPNTSAIRQYC